MECQKPTKKYPQGRTGTFAGYKAHNYKKEPVCAECLAAGREYESLRAKRRRDKNPERARKLHRASRKRNAENIRRRSKENYWANREEALAKNKKYREEHREALREKKKEWYAQNREEQIEKVRQWREENKERRKEYQRDYMQKNLDKYREWNRRREAMRKSLPYEKYSEKDITRLYGNICYLCAEPVDLEIKQGPHQKNVEHLIPISHPDCPGDILSNVRWSHARCNFQKGKRTPEEVIDLFPNMINPYETEELWHAEEKLSQVV